MEMDPADERAMMAAMGLPTSLGGGAPTPAVAAVAAPDATAGRCRAAAWADVHEKVCKRCDRSLGAIMYAPKQWSKVRPCCSECALALRMDGGGDDGDERRGGGDDENAAEAEDEGARATRQLEYYFSDRNWRKDDYLRTLADDDGSVELVAFVSFPRVAALLPSARGLGRAEDVLFLRRCVRNASTLEAVGDRVRRSAKRKKKRSATRAFGVERKGAIALEAATPEELASRKRRAARFEALGGEAPATFGEAAPLPADWDAGDDGDRGDDEGASKWRVAGTSESVRKPYLRLTAAPHPANVRPAAVLERALDWIEASNGDGDYEAWAEQYKSIRQDATVQGLRGATAVRAYEAHARYALDHGDLNEFNQCQTRLRDLHALNPPKPAVADEFAAYGLLYATVVAGPRSFEAARELRRCYGRRGPVAFALEALRALNAENDAALARLAEAAPPRCGELLAYDAGARRARAYETLLRAYAPSLPVRRAHALLGFADEPSAGDAYLAERGAVTDDGRATLLVRPSRDGLARYRARACTNTS